MNKDTLEHLSSLMDGELNREAGLFLTRRLGADQTLGKTWARYHLIRDCLRQPGAGLPIANLSAGVGRAINVDALVEGGSIVRIIRSMPRPPDE